MKGLISHAKYSFHFEGFKMGELYNNIGVLKG